MVIDSIISTIKTFSFEEQVHKARLYNDLWSSAHDTRILLDDLVDDNLNPIIKGNRLMVSPEVLTYASDVLPTSRALRRAINTLIGCNALPSFDIN